jgi:hypothetical protein
MNVLYHGSSKELEGEKLIPHKGNDSDERPENNLTAVYATDHKELAIIMAIIGCKDVVGGSINEYFKDGSVNARLYGKYPKQKYIYLHYLSIKGFSQTKIDKHQFVNQDSVKPIKTEKIKVVDNLHLIKLATEEETILWVRKYGP